MKAVVFKDVKDVAVEDKSKPTILEPRDAIVKVRYTALCGRFALSHLDSSPALIHPYGH